MLICNTTDRWGTVSQAFHWVIVALIVTQLTLASIAERLPLGGAKLAALAWHKSVGITILGLAILRLAWRWANRAAPPLPPTLKPYERALANVSHFLLYALLFVLPLTGWLMSSARNFPVSWFNLVQLPDLVGPDR